MIDLSAYPKFKQDVENKQTSVYPIAVINDEIYISTVKEVMGGITFYDYGLKLSNIKDSINLKSRTFKSLDVTFSLNNYPINNIRLSDDVDDWIGNQVSIYYKSQSCTSLDDCLPIYIGTIRNATYDDKSLNITAEDLSQTSFHKDVPIANLGNSNNVYSKNYINRYIPICYGEVDKAPAVIYKELESEGRLNIITDNVFGLNEKNITIEGLVSVGENLENNLMGNYNSPLFIYKDDYFRVLQEAADTGYFGEYESRVQFLFSSDNNYITIDKNFILDMPQNPPASNEFECMRVSFPSSIKMLKPDEDGDSVATGDGKYINLIDSTSRALDAVIDNPTFANDFLLNEYKVSNAEIPNNESIEEFEGFKEVHDLIPHRVDSDHFKSNIYYPRNLGYDENGNTGRLSYSWMVTAWCWTAAHLHKLEDGYRSAIRIIDMPPANLIKERLEIWLGENGYKADPDGDDILLPQARLQGQIRFNEELRTQWEVVNEIELPGSIGSNYSDHNSAAQLANENYAQDGKTVNFPACLFLFELDSTNDNNLSEGHNIYVGQMESLSIVDTSWVGGGGLFINLFPGGGENVDGTLFEDINEFTIFDPNDLIHQGESSSEPYPYGFNYRSYWNETALNTWSGVSSSCLAQEKWWARNGRSTAEDMNADRDRNIDTNEVYKSGQSCWCLYFPEGMNTDALMSHEISPGRPFLPNSGTRIKPGTFIPIAHWHSWDGGSTAYNTGQLLSYDYALNVNPNELLLDAGGVFPGSSLMLYMDMSNLSSSDSIDATTRTFPFGKLSCTFNPNELQGEDYLTDSNNNFKVRVSATEFGEFGETLYIDNDNDFTVTLMDVAGGDGDLNTIGSEKLWSSFDNEGNEDNLFEWALSEYQLTEWINPEEFTSMVLSYNLQGGNEKRISLINHIQTLGLMQFIGFENALDDNIYADTRGRVNTSSADDIFTNEAGQTLYKYINIGAAIDQSPNVLLQNPADIMYHFIEKELSHVDIVNRDNWADSRSLANSFKFAFSLKDKIDSKKLFEEFSQNCNLIPHFSTNNEFGFIGIPLSYPLVNHTIIQDDVISYKLKHTPISDIYTLVNVKYKKDYESDEYIKQTGYCDGYDFYGNGDMGVVSEGGNTLPGYRYGYYGLEREDNVLEFESDFIRDRDSAIALRDFIYKFYCNRYLIIECSLPLKYINIEVGDIIKFDKPIQEMKSFGNYYHISHVENGQTHYNSFIVTSTAKYANQIKLKVVNLHNCTTNSFSAGMGSLSRRSEIGMDGMVEGNEIQHLSLFDYNILYGILVSKQYKYTTSEQKRVADLTEGSNIDMQDLNILTQLISYSEPTEDDEDDIVLGLLGDVNQDGQVNVHDIIMIIAYILGDSEATEDLLEYGDFNEDGVVDVTDIVQMVDSILAGGG